MCYKDTEILGDVGIQQVCGSFSPEFFSIT